MRRVIEIWGRINKLPRSRWSLLWCILLFFGLHVGYKVFSWIPKILRRVCCSSYNAPHQFLLDFARRRALDTTEDHTIDAFLFTSALDVEQIPLWVQGSELRFHVQDVTQQEADSLYKSLYTLHKQGRPTVLLAKQPRVYPLFFDIDIKGMRCTKRSEEWEGDGRYNNINEEAMGGMRVNDKNEDDDTQLLEQTLAGIDTIAFLTHLSRTLGELYDPSVLRMAVFESHGICASTYPGFQHDVYAKASFHIVFPDIIVERSENCVQRPEGYPREVCNRKPMAQHCELMDHVRNYFDDSKEKDEDVKKLTEQLLFLDKGNTWSEVFDENPTWHECWDDLTGMRLCWTRKKSERNSRVKRPWKAFRVRYATTNGARGPLMLEEDSELSPESIEWSRWGNVADPSGCKAEGGLHDRHITSWDKTKLRRYDGDDPNECVCRLCNDDAKYKIPDAKKANGKWEQGWTKYRDTASKQIFYWHETWNEGFWAEAPEKEWTKRMDTRRGYAYWCHSSGDRYFWDS